MRVYLMRHGSAEARGPAGEDSPDRHLVDKGHEQCALASGLFGRMGVRFDRVISSPYARAVETAEAVLEGMGLDLVVEADERLAPLSSPKRAVETLVAAGSRCLFVVGHEPLLSEMVARAVGYGAADIVLRKGGVVEMDVICTKPLRAELLGLIRPIHLR